MMGAVQLYFMDEIMDDKKPRKPLKKKPSTRKKAGAPTKYKPDFHPEDCIECGRLGMFKVEMAKRWEVDTTTIEEWVKVHKIFSRSYKKACNYRTAFLMEKARSGLNSERDKNFNQTLWSMMMRYDGQNTDERKIKISGLSKCKTFNDQIVCVIGAFSSGKLTPKEANTLADLVGRAARIDEVTQLRQKIEEIEKAVKDIDND